MKRTHTAEYVAILIAWVGIKAVFQIPDPLLIVFILASIFIFYM